jgi:hypothetical protein
MAVSSTFPTWHEFFLHSLSVDSLNANMDKVLHVSSTPTHDAATHFCDAIQFSDCCTLACSTLPGHVLFLHHLNSLGNWILNPLGVKDVAIFSLLDHMEVTIIDPTISFQAMDIKVPPLDILLNISTPGAPVHMVQALLNGIIVLPPFLLADLSIIGGTKISNIYFQAVQSINSWANTFPAVDTTDASKLAHIKQCAPILQWLWACHHQYITATPLHPAVGPAELEYKKFLHQHHNHQPPHPLMVSGNTGGAGTAATMSAISAPDQLTSSLAKIAVLFEQQATSTTEKNIQKTLGWDRNSLQAQTLIS